MNNPYQKGLVPLCPIPERDQGINPQYYRIFGRPEHLQYVSSLMEDAGATKRKNHKVDHIMILDSLDKIIISLDKKRIGEELNLEDRQRIQTVTRYAIDASQTPNLQIQIERFKNYKQIIEDLYEEMQTIFTRSRLRDDLSNMCYFFGELEDHKDIWEHEKEANPNSL